MFTGLIQSVGRVTQRSKGLLVEGCKFFFPLKLGDSIAVDGVCLTVAEIAPDGFWADVSEETLSRTTLGNKAQKGSLVNLEPALKLSDRLGGHLVTGHIDGLGEVVSLADLSQSWILEMRLLDDLFIRYVCEKGSIAIDGVSLTVASLSDDETRFSIAVIPHTWETTSLKELNVGSLVNIEVDLLAKYSERLLSFNQNISRTKGAQQFPSDISREWLESNGWA